MRFWQRFDEHPVRYLLAIVGTYLFINNSINAMSVWSEHNRDGSPNIAMWEPFVWEYSSALSVFVLLPFLIKLFTHFPLRFSQFKRQFLLHFAGTIVFSLLHVLIMVAFREVYYWLVGQSYNFGPWPRELFYEYRKDAWGYLSWLVLFNIYRSVHARLKGEANLITMNEETADTTTQVVPEHFLVKKLDKEFLVKVSEIEWLESAGNYVNLHSHGRIYPLRSTLTELCERLETVGFSRIHRSFGVNHNAIESIGYVSSGDGEITLKNGKRLTLSRRYKETLKERLS